MKKTHKLSLVVLVVALFLSGCAGAAFSKAKVDAQLEVLLWVLWLVEAWVLLWRLPNREVGYREDGARDLVLAGTVWTK
jgi:hypothetical protein